MGRSELSALISVFVSPLGICFSLFFLSIALRKLRPVFSFVIFSLSVVLLLLASTPFVSNTLAKAMEKDYSCQALSEIQEADAIVLLGGGLSRPGRPNGVADLNEAGDRIIHAYNLFRLKKAPIIIVVGGQVFEDNTSLSEADYMQELLSQLGVPLESILLESSSRNTWENASATRALLRQRHVHESTGLTEASVLLLVTSAAHMSRSVYSFEYMGLNIMPAPTDHRSVQNLRTPYPYLPTSEALSLSSSMIREWLALKAYRGVALSGDVSDSFVVRKKSC